MTNVRCKHEFVSPDGNLTRVWLATVRAADGTLHERATKPVLHEPVRFARTRSQTRSKFTARVQIRTRARGSLVRL